MTSCGCHAQHDERRIVLTGGPGAGKTAVLELIRQHFCSHVRVLNEAAGVVFGGGFPRGTTVNARRAAQRAIFHVQRELEACAAEGDAAILLCDRGTVDGVAYWPGPDDFCRNVGTSLPDELQRYSAVIHLRTPSLDLGYNHANPLRLESSADAKRIDDAILAAWSAHPRRFVVESTPDFLEKARTAIALVRAELPDCCRRHLVPDVEHGWQLRASDRTASSIHRR